MEIPHNQPFGLRFCERPPVSPIPILDAVTYDDATDLNYVLLPDGSRHVLVELAAELGTATDFTRVSSEPTDADPQTPKPPYLELLTTITGTKAEGEVTDSDPDEPELSRIIIRLSETQTGTLVQAENTDVDEDPPPLPTGGTMTVTEVRAEATDADPTE